VVHPFFIDGLDGGLLSYPTLISVMELDFACLMGFFCSSCVRIQNSSISIISVFTGDVGSGIFEGFNTRSTALRHLNRVSGRGKESPTLSSL
jgi:hypothetical protein